MCCCDPTDERPNHEREEKPCELCNEDDREAGQMRTRLAIAIIGAVTSLCELAHDLIPFITG